MEKVRKRGEKRRRVPDGMRCEGLLCAMALADEGRAGDGGAECKWRS